MMKKMMIVAVAALMLQSCGMTNPGVNGGSQMGGTTTKIIADQALAATHSADCSIW